MDLWGSQRSLLLLKPTAIVLLFAVQRAQNWHTVVMCSEQLFEGAKLAYEFKQYKTNLFMLM